MSKILSTIPFIRSIPYRISAEENAFREIVIIDTHIRDIE